MIQLTKTDQQYTFIQTCIVHTWKTPEHRSDLGLIQEHVEEGCTEERKLTWSLSSACISLWQSMDVMWTLTWVMYLQRLVKDSWLTPIGVLGCGRDVCTHQQGRHVIQQQETVQVKAHPLPSSQGWCYTCPCRNMQSHSSVHWQSREGFCSRWNHIHFSATAHEEVTAVTKHTSSTACHKQLKTECLISAHFVVALQVCRASFKLQQLGIQITGTWEK